MEEAEKTKPIINSHWSSDDRTSIEIEWLWIPPDMRGKGEGRKFYEQWEASLPETVKLITLFAADSDGRGNSDPFWDRLGFGWVWNAGDDSDIDYESTHRMHKGINGHPTPDSKWWVSEEAPDQFSDDDVPSASRASELSQRPPRP